MDKNFLQFKKPRNGKCKCQVCKVEGKTKEFFRYIYINRNGKPTTKYYCSRLHFHEDYMNKRYYNKTQLLFDKILGYTCVNNQKNLMITNLYKLGFTREDVYKCLLEHKEEIKEYMSMKDIESEYCKLRYISSVLENNIKDYSNGLSTRINAVKSYDDIIEIPKQPTQDYDIVEFKGGRRRKSLKERLGK